MPDWFQAFKIGFLLFDLLALAYRDDLIANVKQGSKKTWKAVAKGT
jgi:hypothetical protein